MKFPRSGRLKEAEFLKVLALMLIGARWMVWPLMAADNGTAATIEEVKNKVNWLRYQEGQTRSRNKAIEGLELSVRDQVQTLEDSKAVIKMR